MSALPNDFKLSYLAGCSLMQIRLNPVGHLNVELIGPPNSNIPGVETSDFPIVSCLFFEVSVRLLKASFSNDGMQEFNAPESSITEIPGSTSGHPKYNVRLILAGAVVDFDCADMYQRIGTATEVSA